MRRFAVASLLAFSALSAFGCHDDPAEQSTAGKDAAAFVCLTADDCKLGQVCIEGACMASPDAGPAGDAGGCTQDSDCPDLRFACARSTGECQRVPGRCLDITDCEAGAFCDLATHLCALPASDAGNPPCYEGQTQSCGKSKVGECRFGLQTCQGAAWGACVNAIDPQQEACDGLDNDCDGSVDEDFDLASDPENCAECGHRCAFPHAAASCLASVCTMGACEEGFWDLDPLAPGCEYQCTVSNGALELCDLADNDCDGQTDEGFDQDGDGYTTCAGDCDDARAAAHPGALEQCNLLDDDCDGLVDEGFDVDGDLASSCAGDCDDTDPAVRPGLAEACDGKDNDCDGATDEELGSTTCGTGECRVTVANCAGGAPQACTPLAKGTETCNGRDDDCDGETDEGLGTLSCGQGACLATVAACQGGVAQTCTPGTPAAEETCDDGIDDDCDGQVDENPPCVCTPGSTQACYTGLSGRGCTYVAATKSYACVGACRAGTQTCIEVGGQPQWGACSGSVVPAPAGETCNGADDDCNGQTDEALGSSTCGEGACQVTVANCSGGVPQTCTPKAAIAEACNGVDDDCDGATDEDLAPLTCGRGVCARTVTACVGGVAQTCTPGAPGTESCNGLDDDCDGATDEALGSTTCGVGECQRTVQNCLGGVAQTCVAGAAAAETCDGKDNNCNGTTDDVSPASLSCGLGACARTVSACVGGVAQTCTAGTPGLESCNNLDDDCDGATDEEIASASCTTARPGVCAAGHTVCSGGVSSCAQDVQAAPSEDGLCGNGLDDDCNGIVDDKPPCGCSAAIDNDADGSNECLDCNDQDGAIKPGATELCDGKDNDCDGLIDEGFDADGDCFTSCGTAPGCASATCATRYGTCAAGLDPARVDCDDAATTTNPAVTCDCAAGCTVNPASGLSSPDGKDNNCNGRTDETCGCSTADKDGDGYTGCMGDCDDNAKTGKDVYPGAVEKCDGKDNDCNANTVENCDVGQTCTPGASGPDVCKERLLCATDVSSGKATCGSLCNTSLAGAGVGDGCRAGESCAASLVISDNDNLCTASGTTGTRAAGDSCSKDADCKSNWCYGTPGVFCADLCGNDKDYCSATTACYVHYVANTTTPYYSYYAGMCLIPATGLVGSKTTGAACTTGNSPPDCRYGDNACVDGRCAEPCCKHADCPSGYFCDPDAISKKLSATLNGRYVDTGAPACSPRTSSGTRVAGAACTKNADCLSQFCEKTNLGGVCVDPCCNDTSCANGTRCEYVLVQKPSGDVQKMRVCVHTPVFEPATSGDPQLIWQ